MNSSSGEGRHDDDSALTEFLASLMDYTPTIPDELVEHYLSRSGFHCPDLRLTRLVAVAAQKFISEVASDALQSHTTFNELGWLRLDGGYLSSRAGIRELRCPGLNCLLDSKHCKARPAPPVKDKSKQPKDKRLVLTMEDLSKALHKHGVNLKHQEYFADSPLTGMDPSSREE
ncbi:transcription initiation factor TFIID subunit 10 isoform X1 [Phoenix dactylifera]|uniref:Transcription initiation factor TFIID subunit 10 isoform X1 n=1 Tax=Phoenix dactylifera TaxID=42345 RepID=A0A8B9AAY8_PHODC|nr:transcription initiation factor TFIID subunit 10 isoform X1 [Phoenix dactylifera]